MFTKRYIVFVEGEDYAVFEVRAHNEEDALETAKERLKEMGQPKWVDKISVELA